MALFRSTPDPMITSAELTAFLADLLRQEAAKKTVVNYRSDLLSFARWLKDSTGEDFAAAAVTPTDVRDYKGYLQANQGARRRRSTAD